MEKRSLITPVACLAAGGCKLGTIKSMAERLHPLLPWIPIGDSLRWALVVPPDDCTYNLYIMCDPVKHMGFRSGCLTLDTSSPEKGSSKKRPMSPSRRPR
jgi:hypothetical protein